ncbi:MAG: light-harvesting protein [Pseudomonadota bacterium]
MNNAKLWLVVPPAVGVPIFLGAVAVGSFSVHVAVLSNTSWVSDFLSGQPLGTGDQQQASAAMGPDSLEAARASFVVPGEDGAAQRVLVILPDGTTTTALIEGPITTDPPPRPVEF